MSSTDPSQTGYPDGYPTQKPPQPTPAAAYNPAQDLPQPDDLIEQAKADDTE